MFIKKQISIEGYHKKLSLFMYIEKHDSSRYLLKKVISLEVYQKNGIHINVHR